LGYFVEDDLEKFNLVDASTIKFLWHYGKKAGNHLRPEGKKTLLVYYD